MFVFNHQNKSRISERVEAFHYNIGKQAKAYRLCLIDTISLFEMIKKKLQDVNIKNFDKNLFNIHGIYKLNKIEDKTKNKPHAT